MLQKNLKITDKRYEIDAILKIVAAILKMAETSMANDISYSGTRQGTFMPNLVLVSPSEIFYQLSAPLNSVSSNPYIFSIIYGS